MKAQEKLRDKIKEIIGNLEMVVGYGASNLPLKVNAEFIKSADEANDLIFNRFCINNLASYAYSLAKEVKGNIGIVLKPCDIKSIVQLLSEELFDREKIKIIAVGCRGVVDYKKIQKYAGGARVISASIEDNKIKVSTIDKKFELDIKDYYADKCYWCDIYDKPSVYDEFIESEFKPDIEPRGKFEDIENFEKMSTEDIMAHWDQQFDKCIRCYACRNVCPLEICRERCITHLDEPNWQSQKINAKEAKFFQMIRVIHLAGRCTECGECERVCPANIPLSKLMKKSGQIIEKLFDYRAGETIEAKPPLLTFKDVEKNIKEDKLV